MRQRWPHQFVEIHPDDARRRGIESGDLVRIWNDDVLIQTGGFVASEDDDLLTLQRLEEKGFLRVGKGEFTGVAMVTAAVRPGCLFTYFNFPGARSNSVVHRVVDPITNRYRFKLGKGRIEKIGESDVKRSLSEMSFAPRWIMPEKDY